MRYELNAFGKRLYYSARTEDTFETSKFNRTIYGTDGNDVLRGLIKINATMAGRDGDDKYVVNYDRTKVVEDIDEGIDTVTARISYTLPANVENLKVTGSDLYAYGNDLDNIIMGAGGRQTINGFGGNDVLKGGPHSDTFVIVSGNGSDVILDFEAGSGGDVVALQGYELYDFGQVVASMTQVGTEVRLELSSDEFLVFRNQAVDRFVATNFDLPAAPPIAMPKPDKLVFFDEFDSLSLYDGTAGTWKSTYFWGDRTLAGNSELEFYVDPAYKNLGLNPYRIDDGVLVISAEPTAAELRPYTDLPYMSGLITSEQSFSMQYGYFEMRAELPAGQGLWPAFWLLPINGKWPPELDVMEVLGHDMNELHTAVHTRETGVHTSTGAITAVPDMSEGFHTYGVDWQRDKITWYFDGVEVFSAPTAADMHQPMYMIANLTIGGYWPGSPDETTPFPAEMKIDHIRAFQKPSDRDAPPVPENWAPIDFSSIPDLDGIGAKTVWDWNYTMGPGEAEIRLSEGGVRFIVGNELDNYIGAAGAQYTELRGGKGNDVLEGGLGTDVFIFRDGDGYDVVLDFSNAEGNRDKLYLESLHFAHFDDVRPWLSQIGGDTLLRLGEDQAVLLVNVEASDLRAEQFAFFDPVPAPVAASATTARTGAEESPPSPSIDAHTAVLGAEGGEVSVDLNDGQAAGNRGVAPEHAAHETMVNGYGDVPTVLHDWLERFSEIGRGVDLTGRSNSIDMPGGLVRNDLPGAYLSDAAAAGGGEFSTEAEAIAASAAFFKVAPDLFRPDGFQPYPDWI